MKRPLRRTSAFSLVELLIVIAILALLGTLAKPEFDKFLARSRSFACMNNLRQIGVGVLTYVQDNDNKYPVIEPNPDDPVYKDEDEAEPLFVELEPYGVTQQVLKCPVDIRDGSSSYFELRSVTINGKKYGSSYQWRPIIDDELATAPRIYGGRRGASVRVVKPSRVLICSDYLNRHFGRPNRLYADGSVRAQLNP